MKKAYFLSFILLILISCSEDYNQPDNHSPKASIKSENSDVIINSLDDFNQLFKNVDFDAGFDNENRIIENKNNILQLKAQVTWATLNGYKNYENYPNMTNVSIIIVDFPTADKLGLKANTRYLLTIYLVRHEVILQSNHRPSVKASPNCGLLLNTNQDDFMEASRGYRGYYTQSSNKFALATAVCEFQLYNSPYSKIYYPTTFNNLEWIYSILVL